MRATVLALTSLLLGGCAALLPVRGAAGHRAPDASCSAALSRAHAALAGAAAAAADGASASGSAARVAAAHAEHAAAMAEYHACLSRGAMP
jgi:hypothetical protein